MRSEFDELDPYNLGFEGYGVWVTISNQFVNVVGAGAIRGRIAKIKLVMGPDNVQWIPKGSKVGIWTKGRPAEDVEYEQIPKEFKIVDVKHISKIEIDVNGIW